jgi:hypothetical protein
MVHDRYRPDVRNGSGYPRSSLTVGFLDPAAPGASRMLSLTDNQRAALVVSVHHDGARLLIRNAALGARWLGDHAA